jgi:multidrug efflux pump subunit AcrA (membrane-fusion protein)
MKNPKKATWMLLGVVCLLMMNACGGFPGQATATPEIEPVEEFNPVVSATGVVVPQQWARLSLQTAGIVEELAVREDDLVSAGQLLLRLEGSEKLEAAISAAKYELAAAQTALDRLYEDPELSVASASQAIVDARLAIRDAERRVRNLSTPSSQASIEQALATVVLAKDKLDDAREDFKPYENKPEDNLTRAALLNKKAQAEQDYDAAVRRLNNLQGSANELDLAQAQADLEMAQAQLAVAERDYEMYQAGPDPAEIALAQERIANAQAQLAAAIASLDDQVLEAPFAGVVSELYVHASEWVAPGQAVLLLADLDHLRVETTDLNEIDVARIEVGDKATVTFDALPDTLVSGTVVRIATKASAGSGVNYPVVIELDEIPDKLRWGMTVFVDIQVD